MESLTRPSIFHGIVAAFVLSMLALFGAILCSVIFYGSLLFKLLLGGVAFLYICILLHTAKGQSGRVLLGTISAVVLTASAAWLGFGSFVLSAVALIWLVRSLTTYSSMILAGVDGMLCALSLLAAVWSFTYSGSLPLAIWCFFLVQSLYAVIPRSLAECGRGNARAGAARKHGEEAFDAAYRAAEEILRTAGAPRC